MVLARDGKGNGNGDSPSTEASKKQLTSNFKNIGLVSLTGATNIVGQFDAVGAAVAPGGVLDASVVPVTFQNFLDIVDDAQLARFGLHNSKPIQGDIVGKWEGLAIAPALDVNAPDGSSSFFLSLTSSVLSLTELCDRLLRVCRRRQRLHQHPGVGQRR
jgi:hypothetical protein